MAEILGKILPHDTYDELRENRLREGQIAIDGLYGVMLSVQTTTPVALMLPALITGTGPQHVDQALYMRMLNRERMPATVHVTIMEGTFRLFDSSILVRPGKSRPKVAEGYLLKHSEVTNKADALLTSLVLPRQETI